MNDLDLYKPLPSVIFIKSAENLLYSIGLSLHSFRSQTRNRFQSRLLFQLKIWFSFNLLLNSLKKNFITRFAKLLDLFDSSN
jgi:hypothetical protein